MATLGSLASQIRSKNAGPVRLTLDVFFENQETFDRVVESGVLTESRVASLYDIPEQNVIGIYELDRITAIKVSLKRPVPAGDIQDTDVYGTQQHVPLIEVEI